MQRLQGPSIDFMIGRIFEGATEDAFDKVVKEHNNGLPILNPETGRMVNSRLQEREISIVVRTVHSIPGDRLLRRGVRFTPHSAAA